MLFGSKQWNTYVFNCKQASHFKWGKEWEPQTTPVQEDTCEILDPDESERPSTFFLFLSTWDLESAVWEFVLPLLHLLQYYKIRTNACLVSDLSF